MEQRRSHHSRVVVAIGGFLCGGGDVRGSNSSFWGIPIAVLEAQGFQVLTVSPSPVGSLHDRYLAVLVNDPSVGVESLRACQVFYELKGGTVCYGQEHSRTHGHACHGETYDSGLFSAWGEDNPVHLIGHSFGGQTARVLHHLIATGFFSKPGGYQTSASWVRSVTACNSPLNGSLLVYSLGERAETAPAVRMGSLGHLLSVVIHMVELLDWAFLRRIFDPRLSHFELSWHRLGWRRACAEFARAVVGDSVIFARPDNAAFDMTVHSAHRWNQEARIDGGTFYFSLVGTTLDPPTQEEVPVSQSATSSMGWFSSVWTRLVTGNNGLKGLIASLIYWALERLHVWQVRGHMRAVESRFGIAPEAWDSVGNDGVLEGFTQSHPRVPQDCETPVSIGFPECPSAFKPGVWYSMPVYSDHVWAHVDEKYMREAFERLAACLTLVTAFNPSAKISKPRYPSVRRSPRLLAKARRLAGAASMAADRSNLGSAVDAVADGMPTGLCQESVSHSRESGIRCDVCLVEAIDARDRKIDKDINSLEVLSEDQEPLEEDLRCRRRPCRAFTMVVLMMMGVAVALFLFLTTPACIGYNCTSDAHTAVGSRECPAVNGLFVYVEGPIG